jgi:hypothetical protein
MNDSSPLSSPSTGHSRSPWNKGKIIGVRYLGVEVDNALEIAEKIDV